MRRLDDRIAWVAIALAVVPLVVAAVRAVVDGWLPLGDNAYFTVRSRDVLGPHHPLLGAWSSGSAAIGTSVNNLGPLQLDLLAPFTKVAPAAGTAIGVVAINVAAVVGAGLAAKRVAGAAATAVVMAAATWLAWTMGSALLIEPRQHHALLLPFLCYLVLCWATASGDRWCLPWAAFAGSLLVQTHFSYLLVAPLVGVWAVVGLVVATRRASPDDEPGPAAWWRPLVPPAAATAAVLLVVWAQSLFDQVARTGNLGRVREAAGGGEPGPGLGTGARIVAGVALRPTAWLRSGFRDFDPASGLPSAAVAGGGFVLVVAVLAIAALVARRRGDPTAVAAVGTAAVAVLAGWLAASRTPAGELGPVAGNYRWLWPITAFTAAAVVMGLVDLRREGRARTAVTAVAGVVLVGLAAANLAASYQVPVVVDDLPRRPVTEALLDEIDDVTLDGPLLVDRSRGVFGEPYTYAVLLDLQRRGVEFTFDTEADVARFGTSRADDGRATQQLVVVTGPAARDELPGAERIAFAAGLDAATAADVTALRARLIADLVAGRLALADPGRAAAAAGEYPAYVAAAADPTVADDFALGIELRRMVESGHLAATDQQRADLDRWLTLQDRELAETVSVFLAPL